MEALLYTLDIALVIYLCRLFCRYERKPSPRQDGIGLFAYKQDKEQP